MELIRYTCTGKLVLTGALHIGSGGGGSIGSDATATDATVIRDSHGRAYIPGSSLRGVLRSAVASYAPALFPDQEIGEWDDDDVEREEKIRRMLEALGQAPSELQVQELLAGELKPGERLFGTVFWASPLLIPDLYPTKQAELAGEVRHGVGIDRDTGAAREQVKYDFEVLPRGQRFDFWLRCEMPKDAETDWTKLLALGLRLLEQGELGLGGRQARGVGQVALNDLQVYRLALDRAGLKAALLANDEARYGTLQQSDWAQRILEAV
jgi:CRISPR-associated protein Csm3